MTAAHQGSVISNVGYVLGGTALWILNATAEGVGEAVFTTIFSSCFGMGQYRKSDSTERLEVDEDQEC